MSLNFRVAIVTGAGSGIGRAASLALLKEGWHVALAGRRPVPLRQTASTVNSEDRTLVVPTDVADPGSVQALFEKTVNTFGRVDLLFNNAGISSPETLLEELDTDEWKRIVDTNLTGMFLCIQQAFRVMKAQTPRGGRIINNGSTAAHVPRPNAIAYTATKHAVTGMTKAASLDGRKYDIACGQIDIGNCATELASAFSTGITQPDGRKTAEPVFDPRIAGESVAYMASLPLDANVMFHTVMATKMPFIGRG